MINDKTILSADVYQTPTVGVVTISTEQPFLAASLGDQPEGYQIDNELTDW